MSRLMLHAGSNHATRDEVFAVDTPAPTATHYPVPHGTLVETIQDHVSTSGFRITNEEYGLWADGDRMFGVWALEGPDPDDDFQLAIGIRNSHDKMFSAGMAVGTRVFVCDNLAFSAEIVIARKHTRHIMRDLDRMVADAAGQIGQAHVSQAQRIEAYKGTELTDEEVHDILIRSVDAQVIANSYIPGVLDNWRDPEHEDFEERNAWSLFNAYTETLKRANPVTLPRRTVRLHGIMDGLTNAFGVESPDFGEALASLTN